MDAETIRNMRLQWFESIAYIADSKLQKQEWLNPLQTNPYFSFVECFEGYFDFFAGDYTNGLESNLSKGLITAAEFEVVRALHGLLQTYSSPANDDYDRAAILDDLSWKEICVVASEVQDRLGEILQNSDELERLTQES